MTGGILFLLAGTVLAGGYLLFLLLRRLARTPVLDISLVPTDAPKWTDPNAIAGLKRSLQQKGFDPAGDYECREFPSFTISGFVHPSERMAGVIYDDAVRGIWVDIDVHYEDGGSLTVTSAPGGGELDPMPRQSRFFCRGSSVEQLFEKALLERGGAGRKGIGKEEFASHFEGQYRKEMRWRMDRGGPTYLEVQRVGEATGKPTDAQRMQRVTGQLQHAWMQEKKESGKIPARAHTADLPLEFQRPEVFRRRSGEYGGPVPRPGIPALPACVALAAALAYWVYYGYQYNQRHFPASLTEIALFFLVIVVLLLASIGFWEFNRRASLCPVLKRIADLRPGAFLVISGVSPTLFYAKERWIGKLAFRGGGEDENAHTCLEAVLAQPVGRLEISRKGILSKTLWGTDPEEIRLAESDFGRKFRVSGSNREFAENILGPTITNAILRLEELGRPFVVIDRSSVRVEVGGDLSSTRREGELRRFLEDAETIVETAAQQLPAAATGKESGPEPSQATPG